jgi:hypothetical protein
MGRSESIPPGQRFEPVWQAAEVAEIRQVLGAGLDLLASELHAAKSFDRMWDWFGSSGA